MKRLPRPLGTTMLSHEYNKTKDKHLKKRLRTHLIKAFITNALFVTERIEYGEWGKINKKKGNLISTTITDRTSTSANKKTISNNNKNIIKTKYKIHIRTIRFEELALGLGLSVHVLEERVNKLLHEMGEGLVKQVSGFNSEYITRAYQNRLFFRSLEGLEKASEWADEVRHQTRIGGYRASNIMAANSASGTELGWLKQSNDIANRFNASKGTQHTKNQTLIINPNGQPNSSEEGPQIHNGSQFLTTSMAVKMLEEKGLNPIPTKENGLLDAIAITHGIYGPNEVKIGATMNDAQGRNQGLNPSDLIEKINHSNRRVKELNIVDDAVDIMDEDIEVI